MNLSQLRYVAALVRYKSFSAAAEAMYVSQPTLSQQIHALETELGTELFTRTTRTVTPTDAGLECAEYAGRILSEVSKLETSMRRYSTEIKGNLNIGLLWSFSYLTIDKMLNEFKTAYPEIRIAMTIDGTLKLYEQLENNRLDIAFVNDSSLINKNIYQFIPVSTSPFCAIVNQLDSLSVRDTVTPEDLIGKNIILPDKNSSIDRYLSEYLKPYMERITVLGSSSQVDTNINIAISNLGISFITKDIAETYQNSSIRIIPLSPQVMRTTGIIFEKKKADDPLVRHFLEYARSYFHLI